MDIYIFGAGASAAEGAPATGDFFAKAYEYLGAGTDRQADEVWCFLESVFEVAIESVDSFRYIPPVDEVIRLVDWCLHVDQGLGGEWVPARLYQVRRALEHLLCAALDVALDRRPSPQKGPHNLFADALSRRPADSYALLSLNYDTLLDDALVAAGLAPDYALEAGGEGPLLLKPHGSLNWARCPVCDQIVVAREQVAHLLPRMAGLRCSGCGNRTLEGVIISPTFLKRYTLPPLTRVFDQALRAMRRASRITFVGYSLPPADVAIHQLLRRALLTRPGAERPGVVVINHRPNPGVVERFTHLFGPSVRFDFSGFHGQT